MSNNVMLKIKGKHFRCSCGCNVFGDYVNDKMSKLLYKGEAMYKCNACGEIYAGDKITPDSTASLQSPEQQSEPG